MKTAWKTFLSSKAVKWVQSHVLISASTAFALCVLIVTVIVMVNMNSKEAPADEQEAFVTSEAPSTEEEPVQRVLECETHPEIHEVMADYFDANGKGDQERIRKYLPNITDMQLKIMAIQSTYLEEYRDIKCYTQDGVNEGSYYVYVTYYAKFKDYEVAVPAIDGFYVCLEDDGTYRIYRDSDMDTDIAMDCELAYQQEDVQNLYDSVKAEYNEVVNSNVELSEFVNGFPDALRNELARQIAIEENNKNLIEQSENPEPEEPTEPGTTDQVKATTTVNVRSSDSETADRLGKVGAGTTLTRLEQKVNGWSKIVYEGKEAYIKTEFLEVVAGSEVPTTNYVTTTTGVNLREKDDETSSRVALAEMGTRLELVEKQSNGWTKVKYNGKEAYVKSEYVE